MLFYLLFSVFVGCLAQQVPCNTGKAVCETAESLSVSNNDYFCCDQGFNMQWRNRLVNGTAKIDCMCNRHFYVSDCIEDQLQCEGATSFTSDGNTVKCCRNGESMNSVSNSIVNGVRTDYCKCFRYVSRGSGFQNRFFPGLRPLNRDQGPLFRSPIGLGQIGQMAGQFIDGLGQGIQDSINLLEPAQRGAPAPGGAATVVPSRPNAPQPLPRPRWPAVNFPQRMFQFARPRRLQQGIRGPNTFYNRVSQNPMVMQLVDPRWWLNQDWRGMFRNDAPTLGSPLDFTTVSPNTVLPGRIPL